MWITTADVSLHCDAHNRINRTSKRNLKRENLRGIGHLKEHKFCSSVTSRSMLAYLIWKPWMSPLIWYMVVFCAPTGFTVTDQNGQVCWSTPEQPRQRQETKQQYWRDVKTVVASALRLSLGCLFEYGILSYLILNRIRGLTFKNLLC